MEENDKQERYQEYKRQKTQIFVEEENKHKKEVEKIEKENRKETIEAMIFFAVFCVPLLIFIIVQWCNSAISLFNIVPFLLVICIFVNNLKSKKENTQNPTISQIKTDEATSYLESLDKDKISNANLGKNKNPTKDSLTKKIVIKIVGCVISCAFVVVGLVFYSKMVLKYKSDEYTIVKAEVVKVVDKTTTSGYYDGDEYVTETDDKCEVTFRYFDGTETVEVKKTFKNTSYVKEKTMKIILRDGKVVATESKMIAGRFLLVYSIIASVLILINTIISNESEMLIILLIGSIFLGAGMSVGISLQISTSALIHSTWVAVPLMLATVAFYWHIYLIYIAIKSKITHKKSTI